VSACNSYIAIGSSNIKVLDLSSGKVVKKFEGGHTALISFLAFTSDSQAVVSTCVGGRDINIFSLQTDSPLPARSIPMVSFPISISLVSTDKLVTVGATTTNGACHVFRVPLESEEKTPDSDIQKCSVLLPAKSVPEATTPKKRKRQKALRTYIDAIAINLLDSSSAIAREALATEKSGSQEGSIVVQLARGVEASPSFESLVLTSDNGSIPAELEVDAVRASTSVLLPVKGEKPVDAHEEDGNDVSMSLLEDVEKGAKAGDLASRSLVEGEVHILGGSQGGKISVKEDGNYASKKRKMEELLADGDDVEDEDQMTMEERANLLQKGFAEESSDDDEQDVDRDVEKEGSLATEGSDVPLFASLGLAKGDVANASSLTTLLQQALQSNDSQLLEHCLGASDPEVIDTTISRLPSSTALMFLHKIVERLERRPNRARALVVWVGAVLFRHTSYLVTVPELVNSLARLYQTIDTRLLSFKKFLKLSGRLELLLEQIQQQNSRNAAVESVSTQPESEFVEGEELDEDEDGGDDDELDESDAENDEDGGEEEVDLDAIVLQ